MSASLQPTFDPIAFHARVRPDAMAAVDLGSGERLTYRDFDARVSATAGRLAALTGAPAGKRIAAVARNCLDLAILSAACERAGAIFAPLNWRLSSPELAEIIVDCAPALLVVQPEFAGTIADASDAARGSAAVLSLGELADARADAAGTAGSYAAQDINSPCVILYTSGTTGRAKGVVITRENALFSSLNFAVVAQLQARSVLLCDAPMFHTVGLIAITRTALHQGACVVLSDRFVPATTLQRLADPALGVSHYFVVPQMVEALIREPGFADADFSRLTALFSGGGPLSMDLVTTCLKAGVMLINGYGMSETGTAIHMPLNPAFIADNINAAGFAAPYVDVLLAAGNGEPVTPGDVGEVWLRGPSVSSGYWNQPAAAAPSRDGGWFRTGDLAMQQENGAYVIVDRLKDMYISGGENVYPAEVEAALRQLEGVVDAAVIGVPDQRWGEAGCAFIQLRDATAARETELAIQHALAGRLARYKIPTHFRFVETVPRTGSGKARKTLLREAFHGSGKTA